MFTNLVSHAATGFKPGGLFFYGFESKAQATVKLASGLLLVYCLT